MSYNHFKIKKIGFYGLSIITFFYWLLIYIKTISKVLTL